MQSSKRNAKSKCFDKVRPPSGTARLRYFGTSEYLTSSRRKKRSRNGKQKLLYGVKPADPIVQVDRSPIGDYTGLPVVQSITPPSHDAFVAQIHRIANERG